MRTPHSRTAVAAVLVAAAMAIPGGAWYLAGSRDAALEADRLAMEPVREAQRAATRLAEHLAIRLDVLREVENRRPFFHYQTHFHDPRSDCECSSVTVSPLAQGPTDPMVLTYFQIDPAGELTLPTLGAAGARENGPAWLAAQTRTLTALRAASADIAVTLRPEGGAHESPGGAVLPAGGECREESVDFASWALNLTLLEPEEAAASRHRSGYLAASAPEDTVAVEVGSLLWRTVPVDGKSTLLAVREVLTPAGPFVQGFVVANGSVDALLRGEAFPASWTPGPAEDPFQAQVVLDGAAWHVHVEATPALEEAETASRGVVARFRRAFAAGGMAALLAGAAVVGLVYQSERIARDRSRFAAAAAHELRTPLAGLRMYGEMLGEGMGHPERAREYARRIAEEADRLARVVENVLGYARLERGETALDPRPGSLDETVRAAVEAVRPALESAGARMSVEIATDLPRVSFDRDAVVRILQNLLDNAEKYSRAAADRTIRVGLVRCADGVALTVADRGPGIPASLRPRVFRAFVRGAEGSNPPGLGLGLTLVHALAAAQGARVEYADAAPNGAQFIVTFPAA